METKGAEIQEAGNITSLPEGCIANIMSFTSPPDACRFSAVSSLFRDASLSDTVWERFLPHDYHSILSQSSHPCLLSSYSSKKHLFLSLCEEPVIIDNGKKSFALDKRSGKKCYMLSARDLRIIWSEESAYWRWDSDRDARFAEVAKLRNVCWLEISGKISTSMLSPSTVYSAYLVFKLTEGTYGLASHDSPVEATVRVVGGGDSESNKHKIYLDESRRGITGRGGGGRLPFGGRMGWPAYDFPGGQNERQEMQGPEKRGDGWLEVELGEFFNDNDGLDEELEASVMEVKSGRWKTGLVIQGIEIRPKHDN